MEASGFSTKIQHAAASSHKNKNMDIGKIFLLVVSKESSCLINLTQYFCYSPLVFQRSSHGYFPSLEMEISTNNGLPQQPHLSSALPMLFKLTCTTTIKDTLSYKEKFTFYYSFPVFFPMGLFFEKCNQKM